LFSWVWPVGGGDGEKKKERRETGRSSGMKCFCVWQAKELSLLTGAQVLLIVTSETGNMYEFATPKFNKVLETFKTWYRASAKDSKRIEVLLSPLPLLPMQVSHDHRYHGFW